MEPHPLAEELKKSGGAPAAGDVLFAPGAAHPALMSLPSLLLSHRDALLALTLLPPAPCAPIRLNR